jgi:hypothetical protein
MKKLFILSLFCMSMAAVRAQTSSTPVVQVAEVLSFKQTSFDFGRIPQGRPVTHVFEVTNTGTTPLRLDNVQASCGCTTPEWSKEPIAPGATSTIKVGYNALAEGSFSKTVSISFNQNQTKTLLITGTVYKTPATSAPVNPSITLLKQTNQ